MAYEIDESFQTSIERDGHVREEMTPDPFPEYDSHRSVA